MAVIHLQIEVASVDQAHTQACAAQADVFELTGQRVVVQVAGVVERQGAALPTAPRHNGGV